MFANLTKKLDIHKVSVIRNTSKCQDAEPEAPEVKTPCVPGPKSKELFSKLRLFQNVEDIELFTNYSKSKGNYLVDADGNTFLDVNMQGSRFPLGYNFKELENILPDCLPALINPISLSAFPDCNYPDKIRKVMKSISPKIPNVCICPCESSAVEQGMKAMMIGYKKHERGKAVKKKALKSALLNQPPGSPPISILSFTNALHGSTLGALNVTHSNPWLKLDVPTLDWPIALYPEYRYPLVENVGYNDYQDSKALSMVEELILKWDKKGMTVAGIIIEPIQCATNNVASPHFFQKLEEISYKYGVYFMLDETKTCCGITGRFWAHEHFCLKCPPDLVSFGGKAQVSGFMHSEDLNPKAKDRLLNISAGAATKLYLFEEIIRQIQYHNLLHNVRTTGDILMGGLLDLTNRYEGLIHSIRGLGLYLAFDLQCRNLRDDFIQKLRRRDDIYTWRNNNEIISQAQRLGLIPANNEIKCPVDFCDGHFIMTSRPDCIYDFRWKCNGHIKKIKRNVYFVLKGILCGQCGNSGITIRPALIFTQTHACIVLDKLEQLLKETELIKPEADSKDPTKCEVPKAARCVKKRDFICEKVKEEIPKVKCPRKTSKKEVSVCPGKEKRSVPQQKRSEECPTPLPMKCLKTKVCSTPKPVNTESKSVDINCLKEITNESKCTKSKTKSLCSHENLQGKKSEADTKGSKCTTSKTKSLCFHENLQRKKSEADSKGVKCNKQRKSSNNECIKDSKESKTSKHPRQRKKICEGKHNIIKLSCEKKSSQNMKEPAKSLIAEPICKEKPKEETSTSNEHKSECNKQEPAKSSKSICEGKQNVKNLNCRKKCKPNKQENAKSRKAKCEGKQNVQNLNCRKKCSKGEKKLPKTSTAECKEKENKVKSNSKECNKKESVVSDASGICTQKPASQDKKKINRLECNEKKSEREKNRLKNTAPSEKLSKKSICQDKKSNKKLVCSDEKSKCVNDQPKGQGKISKKSICEGKQNIKHIDCSKTKVKCKNESVKSTELSKAKRCVKLSQSLPEPSAKKKQETIQEPSSWMQQNSKCKKVIKKRKICGPPKRQFSTSASCPNLT